ncbi:MAG: hypothetical protein PHX61_14600 [Alphaproteobacteria bacterium]|nr:hypothetical protein [Alphaproteobacteria bacterium]
MKTACCEMMEIHLRERTIEYIPKFREYGIPVLDGGSSFIIITFCPWCGHKLPSSLREKWFELMDEMGIDYDDIEKMPKRMQSDEWWR